MALAGCDVTVTDATSRRASSDAARLVVELCAKAISAMTKPMAGPDATRLGAGRRAMARIT
ncbi:hypothetical protein G5B40_05900 [Pikeienuella piscinae]|uniref:Uncharacterized protein n=1 Tax=Pikeienuella piscinae TaxID=2748098 RepID=A0A7L5BXQ0_9RHOB|nr:hypothetical protein [Pikeienuella piscinae]QIE55026.1 hypothetical protein G5B40_05900 [Pikeienuella piscinae]